jgi:hypothetical protein
MTVTFDYYCCNCDNTFCERVNLLNLALNYEDNGYCLPCLVIEQQAENERELVLQLLPYIHSRDCFKKPWTQQDVSDCSRITDHTCFCQELTV